MKKEWKKPEIIVEQFVANEYIAMCWKIKCNVPNGFGFHDKNSDGKYNKGDDGDIIASGKGCGTYHIGVQSDKGPVANAMWQPTRWGQNYGQAYPVFMFVTGKGNNNHHFSKVSDAEWESNPNAS